MDFHMYPSLQSFLTRHVRKLNYILGYNLKIRRGQKSKTKTVNMHAKNCLCTLFFNDILVAFQNKRILNVLTRPSEFFPCATINLNVVFTLHCFFRVEEWIMTLVFIFRGPKSVMIKSSCQLIINSRATIIPVAIIRTTQSIVLSMRYK